MQNRLVAIILCLFCFFPASLWAANQTTDATPTEAEVTTLIAAMSAGETLTFAGSATWTSSVTVDKAITINGGGYTLTAGAELTNGFFYVTGFTDNTNLMRITNFTFNRHDYPATRTIYVDAITLAKLRIDNNTFHYGTYQIEVGGSYGVTDNNKFYNSPNFIQLNGGTRAQGDASWSTLAAGTTNAMFVENNQFICDANDDSANCAQGNAFDASAGGKIVVRYNTWDYDDAVDTDERIAIGFHGSAAGGCENGYWQQTDSTCRRSPSVWEIYNNSQSGKRITTMFTARGGTGLIYNNVHATDYVGTLDHIISLREEEYYETSNWDPLRTAWPAEDQVHNIFIWGNTSQGVAVTAGQISADSYNARCTSESTPYACCTGSGTGTCDDGEAGAFITANREYFLHAPCSGSAETDAYGNTCTHGKASFTGANGAAGTNPTDGDPYPTVGTMTFSNSGDNAHYPYTPYTCPHPLTGLTGTCNTTAGTGGYNVTGNVGVTFSGVTIQ